MCYISAMLIDGRARVLGMEFGVGDLLLRYDYTPRNEVVGGYTGFTMSVRL